MVLLICCFRYSEDDIFVFHLFSVHFFMRSSLLLCLLRHRVCVCVRLFIDSSLRFRFSGLFFPSTVFPLARTSSERRGEIERFQWKNTGLFRFPRGARCVTAARMRRGPRCVRLRRCIRWRDAEIVLGGDMGEWRVKRGEKDASTENESRRFWRFSNISAASNRLLPFSLTTFPFLCAPSLSPTFSFPFRFLFLSFSISHFGPFFHSISIVSLRSSAASVKFPILPFSSAIFVLFLYF